MTAEELISRLAVLDDTARLSVQMFGARNTYGVSAQVRAQIAADYALAQAQWTRASVRLWRAKQLLVPTTSNCLSRCP